MFQITAPVDSMKKIKFYEKLGTKDYYAGGGTVYDWEKRYNFITYINGRLAKVGNFATIDEFKEAIDYCKKNYLNLALTFNHLPSISDDKVLIDEIDNINDVLNPENVIVYDYLSSQFIDSDKKIYISSQSTIYDEETLKGWIKSYPNVERIIFPRDLILDSLEFFMKDKELEKINLEIFIKNQWCYHANSCTSMHEGGMHKGIPFLCNRERAFINNNYKTQPIAKDLKQLFNSMNQCKVCSLYKVAEMMKKNNYKKDIFLKIVGRTMTNEEIAKDVLFIQKIIKVLESNENISYKDFLIHNISLYKKIWGKHCNYKSCEYYDILKK